MPKIMERNKYFRKCFFELNLRHAARKRRILYHTIKCAKLETKLLLLYENLELARAELICNPYYIGVIDPCELNYIRDQTITNVLRTDIFVLYEVDLNGCGQFDARIYSPCGFGVNIKLVYDDRKWTFYTDVNPMANDYNDYMLSNFTTRCGNYATGSRGPHRHRSISLFLKYEDNKYKNFFFNSLEDLVKCVSTTYICESCYRLLDYPTKTRAICL